jgi:hypothetical protein
MTIVGKGSGERGTGAARSLTAKCGDQFQGRNPIGGQFFLFGHPGFRGRDRLERPSTLRHGPDHHSAIDQEQEDGHASRQGRLRPIFRAGEIILEVKTSEAESLFDEGFEMLVVPVATVGSQAVNPLARQVTDG